MTQPPRLCPLAPQRVDAAAPPLRLPGDCQMTEAQTGASLDAQRNLRGTATSDNVAAEAISSDGDAHSLSLQLSEQIDALQATLHAIRTRGYAVCSPTGSESQRQLDDKVPRLLESLSSLVDQRLEHSPSSILVIPPLRKSQVSNSSDAPAARQVSSASLSPRPPMSQVASLKSNASEASNGIRFVSTQSATMIGTSSTLTVPGKGSNHPGITSSTCQDLRAYNTVRGLVPSMKPIKIVTKDVLLPCLAFLYRSERLLVALVVFVQTPGRVLALLVCAGVFDSPPLAVLVFVMLMPTHTLELASMNRVIVKKLLRTFEVWYVISNTARLFIALCFLFREYPLGIFVSFYLCLGNTVGAFQDALPEHSRILFARAFFTGDVIMLSMMAGMLFLNLMNMKEYTFKSEGMDVSAKDQALFSIGTLWLFASKNLALSVFKPGSLVIIKSEVVCVKLDTTLLDDFRRAHGHLVTSSDNHTLKKVVKTLTMRLSSVNYGMRMPSVRMPSLRMSRVPKRSVQPALEHISEGDLVAMSEGSNGFADNQ